FPRRPRDAARDGPRGRGGRCARRDGGGAARIRRSPANAARRERRVVLGVMTSGEDSNVIVILVRDVMTREVVTIGPEMSCDKARRLMDELRIRHLPVVDGGRLVGMVSDRDVRSVAVQSPGTLASRIMTPDPVTVTPDTRVEYAARIMLDRRF